MSHLPATAELGPWHNLLIEKGYHLYHRGKVRDTYLVGAQRMLLVARDSVSIFDVVLSILIALKGQILTALSNFWMTTVLKDFPNHLIASGPKVAVELGLPNTPAVQELCKRAVLVQSLDMEMWECVVRGYLTGSGWRDYSQTGEVCGHTLPPGLHDGSRLPEPIFTPATKAQQGHDVNTSYHLVDPVLAELSLEIFRVGAAYAWERGIILADTKFEFGSLLLCGETRVTPLKPRDAILADEVFTPDSSRFWDRDEWHRANELGKPPSSFDKEIVRTWGLTVDTPWGLKLNKLDVTNPEHVAFAQQLTVPTEVVEQTFERYHTIFKRLTGMTLAEYQVSLSV